MSERVEKVAGKFRLQTWPGGFPLSIDLLHQEPNGDVAQLRLFGVEELHDLKFVVDRALAIIENTT